MASTYSQPKKKEDLQEQLKNQGQAAAQQAATEQAQMQKLQLGDMQTGGFTPSQQLQMAQYNAQNMQQYKPLAYESAYTDEMQKQFEAIMNRQPFSYDVGTDPLFQQYSDMYVQKGRRAMQDTMGQAAALTGGYGNSYAQGAGQAAYGNYLQDLGAMAPQFQQQAYSRWQNEGQDMVDRYNMMAAREESDYGRYQDAVNNYWAQYDRAQQEAQQMYEREYGQYTDNRDFEQRKTEWEQSVNSENRDYAYNTALMILQGGQMPSSELLAAAGLSEADAKALMAMYTPKKSSSGSSGSSGQKKQGSTGATTVYVNPTTYAESGKETLEDQSKYGNITLTDDTKVSDGVMGYKDWLANQKSADPFAAAKAAVNKGTASALSAAANSAAAKTGGNKSTGKGIVAQNADSKEAYKDYVAGVIESDLLSGRISETKAANLVKKYLLD